MRSVLALKIFLACLMKFFAMLQQLKTYDRSYMGLTHDYIIEPDHYLQFWDFVFEWAMVAVVYGLYPTMHGLIQKVQNAAEKQYKAQVALKAKEALLQAWRAKRQAKKGKARKALEEAAAKDDSEGDTWL